MVPRFFRSTVFAGLAAAVFAGACAYADPFVCETERARSPYPVSASPFHDHDRYAPRAASVIEYAAFVPIVIIITIEKDEGCRTIKAHYCCIV